jgi:hypothetical protein
MERPAGMAAPIRQHFAAAKFEPSGRITRDSEIRHPIGAGIGILWEAATSAMTKEGR